MKRFYPDEYLEKVMPGGVTKNGLLYDNLSIKQRYMRALYKAAGKEGKALKETISKTIEFYAQKEEKMGAQTLLTRRIENFLVWNKVQEEKEAHKGEFYRWMPSDAQNPDPEHQLLYGKIFRVGEGDKDGNMPGERYGCRCGIEWLSEKEMTAEEKSSAVNVKLGKDTILPTLNNEDLKRMGLKKEKPVVWTERSSSRSTGKHKDITAEEYNYLIGNSLYQHKYPVFRDVKNKNYWHFIGTPEGKRTSSPVVLLDVEEKKHAFEIVHVHRMEANSLRRLLRKIKKKD